MKYIFTILLVSVCSVTVFSKNKDKRIPPDKDLITYKLPPPNRFIRRTGLILIKMVKKMFMKIHQRQLMSVLRIYSLK